MKIKKGDTVKILKGKDNGKTGKVIRVNPKDETVLVEGLNFYKKHTRPKRQGEKGEVIQISRPVKISNIGFFCTYCNRSVRLGFRLEKDQKVRFCRKCKNTI
ncbi:MAG: 50S ribosomal protein L24 [Patescibacteria group bacterium]|nr:50S ribosomal protein L24 [Patescibacteria group bacterium]